MSFTFHAAFLAFAIAGAISFANAVKTKFFLDRMIFLLSGACYYFVTFTSTIDRFSCFRILMCLHEMLSSMLLFECSALSFKSLNRVSFSPFTYFFNQLIESPVFLVIICSHKVSSNTTKLVVHALLYSRIIRLFLSTYPLYQVC